MPNLTIRTLCCAGAGALAALLARRWMALLLQQRGKEITPSAMQDRILVLLLTLCGAAVGALTTGWISAVCGLLLLAVCETAAVIDWNVQLIPNETVLALFALALLFGIPSLLGAPGFPPFDPIQSLLGMVACFAVFFIPGLFGKHVGAGDIKLAAATGFFLGLSNALIAVVLMGLIMFLWCAVQRKMPLLAMLKSNIPMGPFITAGLFATFLWTKTPL